MRYWLFKSEPDVFGYSHLKEMPNQTEHWDGVRNYQARNTLRDDIQEGDKVLFYHSRCAPPHAAGIAVVTRPGYPDHTARDPKSNYYDEKSTEEKPRWYMVDIQAERELERPVSLAEMKANAALSEMKLVQKGNRLSVFEITETDFEEVLRMARQSV
ncbi:MAG: putative RNA-binding protein with PUA-like domain [Bradymonadia bacterium]|jgi:predicted RNA-binding protein with PUA-like domain